MVLMVCRFQRRVHGRSLTRYAVLHQNGNRYSPWRWKRIEVCESFLLSRPLQFITMILKPNLHLNWRQANDAGQMFAFRGGEITLLAKSSFKFVRLRFREKNSSFPFLGRVSAVGVCLGVSSALVAGLIVRIPGFALAVLIIVIVVIFVVIVAILNGSGNVATSVVVLWRVAVLIVAAGAAAAFIADNRMGLHWLRHETDIWKREIKIKKITIKAALLNICKQLHLFIMTSLSEWHR